MTVFEAHPDRIGRLVDALVSGNYRDTAATLAGIAARSVRGWMDAAEKGDPRFEAVGQVIRIAEALAEAGSVRNVRYTVSPETFRRACVRNDGLGPTGNDL